MHSAILRGTDFLVESFGLEISHAGYCNEFHTSTKVGIYTPNGIEAIGATNLILLFVTSFYDRMRSIGEDFYLYPEFYTFQENKPVTDYAMFDIYPLEKNVFLENGLEDFFQKIEEKKFNILLIPEDKNIMEDLSEAQIKEFSQYVQRYYLYSEIGEVSHPNLKISTHHNEIPDWINDVIDTYRGENKPKINHDKKLIQSFQEFKFPST